MAKPEFGMSCATCPCYEHHLVQEKGQTVPAKYGNCQMNPPAVLVTPPQIIGGQAQLAFQWPVVQETHHCWQWPQMVSLRNTMLMMQAEQEAQAKTAEKMQ